MRNISASVAVFMNALLLFTMIALPFMAEAPSALAEEPPLEVLVKPGDTLNELCKQHLQDPSRCMEIARMNRLKDPDRIEPGEKIVFPAALLKARPVQALSGTVTFVKGSVVVREKDAAGWRIVSLGDPVLAGSKLLSGPDGSAELAFEDGSSLLLRPHTEFEVTALQRASDGSVKRFFLAIGRLVSKAAKQVGAPSRTEIRTATAVAGTRGTRFGLTVLEDRTTRAEVQEGTIGVSAMGREVEVREGEGTVVKEGMPPEEPSRLLPRPAPADLRQQYAALPVTIRLAGVAGARSTRATLSRDQEGRDVVSEQVLAPEEPFQASELASGTYYLHTRSVDAKGIEGLEGDPAVVHLQLEQQPAPETPGPQERTFGEAIITIIMVIAAILL